MNRNGGGTGNGTHVIGWTFNNGNNWFDWPTTSVSWCPGGYVHNGENGLFCPFSYGSGLNSRYHGDSIRELLSPNTGKCITPDSIANSIGYAILNSCGANGYLWVLNVFGGTNYLINVGRSNYAYDHGGGSNTPYFINAAGHGIQMEILGFGNNGFFCYGTCSN
jgi:hypothetical protein